MDKRTVKLVMVVAILLVVALYFIGGTYARYASDFEGEGTVTVAKWAVKVAGEETKDFTLTLTPDDDNNIVNEKIAPSYSASGEIDVDLTGTEVAVELSAVVGKLTGVLAENDKVTVATTVETQGNAKPGDGDVTSAEEGSGYKIALPSQTEGFTEDTGKYKVKITVTWLNENSPDQDVNDTTAGKQGGEVQVPVTLKLLQQVKAD